MIDQACSQDLVEFLSVVRRHLRLLDECDLIAMDTDLEAMGLESISALNLMLDLEIAFNVSFETSMFSQEIFSTPQSLWEAISSLK